MAGSEGWAETTDNTHRTFVRISSLTNEARMFTGFILFLVLAIITFAAYRRSSPTDNTRIDNHKVYGILFRIFGAVSLIFLMLSTATIVPAGNVGVQILYGNVQQEALESGFHVINPLYDIQMMDVRTQAYTMSA